MSSTYENWVVTAKDLVSVGSSLEPGYCQMKSSTDAIVQDPPVEALAISSKQEMNTVVDAAELWFIESVYHGFEVPEIGRAHDAVAGGLVAVDQGGISNKLPE